MEEVSAWGRARTGRLFSDDRHRRFYRATSLMGGLVVAALSLWWVQRLRTTIRLGGAFDDAYMFWRYAVNVRHGLGISWNLDGVPTYGQTAPLWGAAVLLVSFFPGKPETVLIAASWTCSVLAVAALGWAVRRNAASEWMRGIWRVLPLVAIPMALSGIYRRNAMTGMETMLAVGMLAVYAGLALRWQRGRLASHWLGLAGFLLSLVRPEALLIAVLLPLCSWLLLGVARRELAIVLGMLAACVAVDLTVCQLYFHSAVPLSFYMKSGRGYQGFADNTYPIAAAWNFVFCIQFYLACTVLFVTSRNWRLLATFVVPALVVFAYLMTTLQVMGYLSRYYLPYAPLFVVPALLLLDDVGVRFALNRELPVRVAVVLLLLVACASPRMAHLAARADELAAAHRIVYDAAEVRTKATAPLLTTGWPILDMSEVLLAPLPRGATIAATEVGYLGIGAPEVNIIDLAGLNDTRIALHGFDRDDLLARKPDIIWLPHPDYTYERAMLLSDPALLEQYDVYAGAEVFGIAIRKQTPYREALLRQMRVLWSRQYPDFAMSDYLVERVTWSGRQHELGVAK